MHVSLDTFSFSLYLYAYYCRGRPLLSILSFSFFYFSFSFSFFIISFSVSYSYNIINCVVYKYFFLDGFSFFFPFLSNLNSNDILVTEYRWGIWGVVVVLVEKVAVIIGLSLNQIKIYTKLKEEEQQQQTESQVHECLWFHWCDLQKNKLALSAFNYQNLCLFFFFFFLSSLSIFGLWRERDHLVLFFCWVFILILFYLCLSFEGFLPLLLCFFCGCLIFFMSQQRQFQMVGGNNNNPGQYNDTTLTKIFVGGLAWETQRDTMRRYFEQFGEILEAVVITDKNTGRSKGYGFVSPFPFLFGSFISFPMAFAYIYVFFICLSD